MIRFSKLCFLIGLSVASMASAENFNFSGKNDVFENPFVAIGFNKANNVLTGSISVTRTAPGETDECRILFSGETEKSNLLRVQYFELNAADGSDSSSGIDKAVAVHEGTSSKIKFDKKNLNGGCEWILSYVGAPSIKEQDGYILLELPKRKAGDWIGVHTIKSKRANFHKNPREKDVEKAFLVAGDTIYVYEENPSWYHVKYQGRKKQTVGWIKKVDTVQFQ